MQIPDAVRSDPFPALAVQDAIFRDPRWHQLLPSLTGDFVLVRFPDRINDLLECCAHFEYSIAIVERQLLDPPEPPRLADMLRLTGTLRLVAKVSPEEPVAELERLLLLGCYGFIHDHMTRASLGRVLRAVASGEIAATRRVLSRVLRNLLAGAAGPKLSRREHEVLALLGHGLSNKRIATELFISEETLRWHLRNLYAKTRLHGRAELVEYASTLRETNASPAPVRTFAASGHHRPD
jgi:DNA-binding CsgD family transcriptional regulator